MSYTETTSVSWFSRLRSSFGGIGFGILLILGGTFLLWSNEGRFVATGDALTEAQGVTQELGNIATLDSSKNGQLVHATGPVTTTDVLVDPIFNVSANAIRLERSVEYYQWTETSKSEKRKKVGGGEETVTTYTYQMAWVSSPVNSSAFKSPEAAANRVNTIKMPLEKETLQATTVNFGAYKLPKSMISLISGPVSLSVNMPDETREALNAQLAPKVIPAPVQTPPASPVRAEGASAWEDIPAGAQQSSDTTHVSAVEQAPVPAPVIEMVHVLGDTIYVGEAPARPEIGDMRVAFKQVLPGTISILAKLNGDTFESYRAANGKTVLDLSMGTLSLENMYGDAHSSNSTMTWILRILGALLVIFGLKMVMAPLAVVASVIPFLGDIVGAGTGIICFLLGGAWSLLIISIAWLRFRPIIGGALLAVAVLLIVLSYLKGRGSKAAKA